MRPAPAAALVQEDPAIIALGERIEPLLAAYRNAAASHREARANAEASCPAVPEELVCEGCQWASCAEPEVDVEGKEILTLHHFTNGEPYLTPRRIFDSEMTKAAIERGNLYFNRRTKFGKQLAKLIETAERYETDSAAAIERSGLTAARGRLYEAAYEIERLAYEASEIGPRTASGALIQARALSAYAEVEIDLGHYRGRSGQVVGLALGKSILRVASGGKAVQS